MSQTLRPPSSSVEVSARMRLQKTSDTQIELSLRRELFGRGLRFRLQGPAVPGTRRKADLEFRAARVAVFVDGCFWHACPTHGSIPKSNAAWWTAKLSENAERDRDSDDRLTSDGWLVVRVWEHESPAAAADRVEEAVRTRSGTKRLPRADTTPRSSGTLQHGRLGTYTNHECRCDDCRAANATYQRELLARYREEGGRGAHGMDYRYRTGCRCDSCRAAHARADREYRRSRKSHKQT